MATTTTNDPQPISNSPGSLVSVWWAAKRLGDRVLELQAAHDLKTAFGITIAVSETEVAK